MSHTAPTAAAAAPAVPMNSTAPTAVSSTTTAPTTVSNTTTAQPGSGSRLGDKLRGAFDVVHGAGEILRGGALSAADDIGDGIARRQSTSEKSDAIAQKGADEYAGGLGRWKEPKY